MNKPLLYDASGRVMNRSNHYGLLTDEQAIPHVLTFSSILTSGWRAYWHEQHDEALKNSREDAMAMWADASIQSLIDERILNCISKPWRVEVPDEKDPLQKEVQSRLTTMVERIPFFQKFLRNEALALWYGRYANNVKWKWENIEGHKCLCVKKWSPINGDKIGYQTDGTPYVMVNPAYTEQYGKYAETFPTTYGGLGLSLRNPWWREQFVIHKHNLDDADYFEPEMAGAVGGVGLRSYIYWWWFLRQEWLERLSNFIDQAALGVKIWYYPMSNPTAREDVISAAKDLSANRTNIFVPVSEESYAKGLPPIERVDVPMGGAEFLRKMIEYTDEVMERRIVGQTMSGGDDGKGSLGGTGRADFARDTKFQILKYDCNNLAETITGSEEEPGLISMMQKYSFPNTWDKFKARFVFSLESPESKEKLDAISVLIGAGLPIKQDDAYNSAGLTKPGEGDETIGGQQPGMPGQDPMAGGMPPMGGDAPEDGDNIPEDAQGNPPPGMEGMDDGGMAQQLPIVPDEEPEEEYERSNEPDLDEEDIKELVELGLIDPQEAENYQRSQYVVHYDDVAVKEPKPETDTGSTSDTTTKQTTVAKPQAPKPITPPKAPQPLQPQSQQATNTPQQVPTTPPMPTPQKSVSEPSAPTQTPEFKPLKIEHPDDIEANKDQIQWVKAQTKSGKPVWINNATNERIYSTNKPVKDPVKEASKWLEKRTAEPKVVKGIDQWDFFNRAGEVLAGNPSIKPDILAKVAGGSQGAEFSVRTHGLGMIGIDLEDGHHEVKEQSRTLEIGDDGSLIMSNDYKTRKRNSRGKGGGAAELANQVQAMIELGGDRITTLGARGSGMVGYLVWPILGFNAEIDEDTQSKLARSKKLPENVRQAKTIRELVSTPEGRQWWKKHGDSTDFAFDISEGSEDIKALNAYLDKKGLSQHKIKVPEGYDEKKEQLKQVRARQKLERKSEVAEKITADYYKHADFVFDNYNLDVPKDFAKKLLHQEALLLRGGRTNIIWHDRQLDELSQAAHNIQGMLWHSKDKIIAAHQNGWDISELLKEASAIKKIADKKSYVSMPYSESVNKAFDEMAFKNEPRKMFVDIANSLFSKKLDELNEVHPDLDKNRVARTAFNIVMADVERGQIQSLDVAKREFSEYVDFVANQMSRGQEFTLDKPIEDARINPMAGGYSQLNIPENYTPNPTFSPNFEQRLSEIEPINTANYEKSREQFTNNIAQAIDNNTALSEQQKSQYKKDSEQIFSHFTPAMWKHIEQNSPKVGYYGTHKEVSQAAYADMIGHERFQYLPVKLQKEYVKTFLSLQDNDDHDVAGAYASIGRDASLYLDGGDQSKNKSSAEIHAHEIGHAIDGINKKFSQSLEWKEIFLNEINTLGEDGDWKLSRYASLDRHDDVGTGASEAFAEMMRLVLSGKRGLDEIESTLPMASKFLKAHGLWPGGDGDGGSGGEGPVDFGSPEFDASIAGVGDNYSPEQIEEARRLWKEMGEESPYFKKWSGGAPVVSAEDANHYQFETGKPIVVEGFHGARRSDRIDTHFDPKRATSGPMAFFTSDPDIASNYSTNKSDTSISTPESYAEWFKLKPKGSRTPKQIDQAWYYLSYEDKQKIAALAPRITSDDDGNIVLEDEDHNSGPGGYDWAIKEKRGNHLAALVDQWLDSGNLFDQEEKFLDVLKLAGINDAILDDPNMVRSGVYPVYIKMSSPLNTQNIPDEVVSALENVGKRKRGKKGTGVDPWDKNYISGSEWLQRLRDDLQNGTSYVWTSIPDWVTKTLQEMGYDGIVDKGGKYNPDSHIVYIPFGSNQIKSATGNRGTFDAENPRIDKMFAGEGAKTADKSGAKLAQELIGDRKYSDLTDEERQQIREQTGYFPGQDGKLRFEIDDSKAEVIEDGFNSLRSLKPQRLGDVLNHPELYEAYPDLAKLRIRMSNKPAEVGGRGGKYYPGDLLTSKQIILGSRLEGDDLMGVLLHEVQHAIQHKEGFVGGGSVGMFRSENHPDPVGAYQHLAGENEANATKADRNLTAEQRLQRQPYDSAPKQVGDWIVRDGKGTSFSIEPSTQPADPHVEVKSATDNLGLSRRERQIRSPEFKRWFGDYENDPENASKVVDEQGKPLVVYHGTNADFNEFSKRKSGKTGGKAFFFTTEPWFADGYSNFRGDNGGNVMSVYLDIKKPFVWSNPEHLNKVKNATLKILEKEKNKPFSQQRGIDPYLNIDGVFEKIAQGQEHRIENRIIEEAVKKSGFDGYIISESGVTNYAVFSPNQIKSATANSGDFSTEDARIDAMAVSDNKIRRLPQVPLGESIRRSGLSEDYYRNSAGVYNSVAWLQHETDAIEGGYALGITDAQNSDYAPSYFALSEAANLKPWTESYREVFGNINHDERDPVETTREFMDAVAKSGKPIVMFVPNDALNQQSAWTRAELEYLREHPELRERTHFVFGGYDVLNESVVKELGAKPEYVTDFLRSQKRDLPRIFQQREPGEEIRWEELDRLIDDGKEYQVLDQQRFVEPQEHFRQSLTQEQYFSLENYSTNNGYQEYNGDLQAFPFNWDKKGHPSNVRDIALIREAFDKVPETEVPLTLYRGIPLDKRNYNNLMGLFQEAIDKRLKYMQNGFFSASVSPTVAGKDFGFAHENEHTIVFEVEATKGIYMGSLSEDSESISDVHSEMEFLMDHQTVFEPLSIERVEYNIPKASFNPNENNPSRTIPVTVVRMRQIPDINKKLRPANIVKKANRGYNNLVNV